MKNQSHRRIKNLLTNLLDNISDQIYFKDLESRFIMVNKASAEWHKWKSPKEAVGLTDFDIYKKEDACRMQKDETHILECGEPILGIEEHEVWQDGEEAWVSTSKMPLRDKDGSIIGTFGISRDITEHKKAEIQAARYSEENRCFREELENDLRMAAQLQKTYFPSTYPVFSNEKNNSRNVVEFSHLNHLGGIIGGDFCSVRKLSETEAGIFICDVMGHGIRAALVTASIRAMVEEISHKKKDPADFLEHMNQTLTPILRQDDEFLFVTACYMVLDVSTGMLRCSNAGHPYPIILNAQREQVAWLSDDSSKVGPALAICESPEFETTEHLLHPGDAVFMSTDGIYEVTNEAQEEFGMERLLKATQDHLHLSLADLFSALLVDASHFSETNTFDDDVCLVGFHLKELLSS